MGVRVSGVGLGAVWRNFLDYESAGAPSRQRLALLYDTIEQAKLRVRRPWEREELEYAHLECERLMDELGQPGADEMALSGSHRFRRLVRVASHYESALERINRRYWWLLCLIGLGVVGLAILCGPVPDCACLDSLPLAP